MLFIEVLAVILVEDFCDVTSYRNNPLRKAAVLKSCLNASSLTQIWIAGKTRFCHFEQY